MREHVVESEAPAGLTDQVARKQFVDGLEQRALVPSGNVARKVDIEGRPDDGKDLQQ